MLGSALRNTDDSKFGSHGELRCAWFLTESLGGSPQSLMTSWWSWIQGTRTSLYPIRITHTR